MFLEHFNLREQPFGVTPDPRFLYMGSTHREALASLYYGIEEGRGFMAMIARPGMGKTTLLFHVLQKFKHAARTAFVFQTLCDSREFVRYVIAELGFDISETDPVKIHSALNEALVQEARAGRRIILVVDEAQNLDQSVLETVRLLSNFETPRAKLLQIILSGQPQLADRLARPELKQLKQRLASISRLKPLTSQDIDNYIQHRLKVAGYQGAPLFTPKAIQLIGKLSEGVPRNINQLCFNSLSTAYALGRKTINASIVQDIAIDLDLDAVLAEEQADSPRAMHSLPYLPARYLELPDRAADLVFQDDDEETAPEMTKATPPVTGTEVSDAPPLAGVITSPKPPADGAFVATPIFYTPIADRAASVSTGENLTQTDAPHKALGPTPAPNAPALKAHNNSATRFGRRAALLAMPVLLPVAVLVGWRAARTQPVTLNNAPDAAVSAGPAPVTIPAVSPPEEGTAPERKQGRPVVNSSTQPPSKHHATASKVAGMPRNRRGHAAQDEIEVVQPGGKLMSQTLDPRDTAPAVEPPGAPELSAALSNRHESLGQSGIFATTVMPATATSQSPSETIAYGRLIAVVEPVYPQFAQSSGLTGAVVVNAVVTTDGKVKSARVMKGNPALAQAALDAVRHWRWEPSTLNGTPIEVTTQVTVNFMH